MSFPQVATVAQLHDFDEVIDARSPAEYALDHYPMACNLPVLDDAERARVGTLYKQVGPFEAKRLGAAIVARNIANHLEHTLASKPRSWRPLIYCWRGGGRSAAMCEVLSRVGWRPSRLQGGYQAYRRVVVQSLSDRPAAFNYRVICGKTGSAKSRVLEALSGIGAQVLDLEALANHRGSVLGEIPGTPQPGQKYFESLLLHRLHQLDPARPVFVEAESRKVGNLQVPEALIQAMRASACIHLKAERALRISFLLEEYRHFLSDPENLRRRLAALTRHYGHTRIDRWQHMAASGDYPALVAELLDVHYDPAYERSANRNFPQLAHSAVINMTSIDPPALADVAQSIVTTCR